VIHRAERALVRAHADEKRGGSQEEGKTALLTSPAIQIVGKGNNQTRHLKWAEHNGGEEL